MSSSPGRMTRTAARARNTLSDNESSPVIKQEPVLSPASRRRKLAPTVDDSVVDSTHVSSTTTDSHSDKSAQDGPLADYRLRRYLANWVDEGTSTVVAFQRFFGISTSSKGPALFYYLFCFGAALGNEITFISVLPALCWHSYSALSREVVLLWTLSTCIGQCIKDILRLPRPPCPPVVKLEGYYQAEYGCPSTHVMGGVCLPFSAAHFAIMKGLVEPRIALGISVTWLVLVTLSRLYLGVHSPCDLTVGGILGVIILGLGLELNTIIEANILTNPWLLVIPVWCVAVFVLAIYPSTEHWSNTYGDVARISGVYVGVITSFVVIEQLQLSNQGYVCTHELDNTLYVLVRTLIGVMILMLIRALAKAFITWVMVFILPHSSTPTQHRYAVEVPVCLLTYAAIGSGAVLLTPLILRFVGLCHPDLTPVNLGIRHFLGY